MASTKEKKRGSHAKIEARKRRTKSLIFQHDILGVSEYDIRAFSGKRFHAKNLGTELSKTLARSLEILITETPSKVEKIGLAGIPTWGKLPTVRNIRKIDLIKCKA